MLQATANEATAPNTVNLVGTATDRKQPQATPSDGKRTRMLKWCQRGSSQRESLIKCCADPPPMKSASGCSDCWTVLEQEQQEQEQQEREQQEQEQQEQEQQQQEQEQQEPKQQEQEQQEQEQKQEQQEQEQQE